MSADLLGEARRLELRERLRRVLRFARTESEVLPILRRIASI